MTFRRKMMLVYLVGGLLPVLLIVSYLIHGTKQILVKQAEDMEMVRLEEVERQILEMQNTMTTMSQYFYFDSKLEQIASKNYTEYQDMIDDFKGYTAFLDYQKYYNNIISNISVFLTNDTLRGNLDFVVVDEEIAAQEWYIRVCQKGSKVVWTYLPHEIAGYHYAPALTRMIKTKKGEDVGVLVIYIRPERFEGYIYEHEGTSFISLNGETVITSKGKDVTYEDIKDALPDGTIDAWQGHLKVSGQEYVVTCRNVRQDDTKDYIQVVNVRLISDILTEANTQSIKSILFVVIGVILAISIVSVLAWSYDRRINRFRAQMQKAAAGNFELDKTLGGNDEISDLYAYLNTMIWDIQKLLAGIYQERIHAEQLKTKQKDAEFMMLTSQINPHFLYNTLETIRMKARVNKQYEIEDLVKMLAKILRSNIRAGEKDVTIHSEVELVEYYLKIQQYRFGEKVQYQIMVEDEVKEYKVLPLILQPIVENAIVHGLEGQESNGWITIDIKKQELDLLIVVADNGSGIEADELERIQKELENTRLKGEHIGVCNVQHRIRLKYGKEYGISIHSIIGEGTRVEIRLPAVAEE